MALPVSSDLNTLNFANEGVPFNKVESKSAINTFGLEFVFKGTPFIAALNTSAPVVNKAQFFMVF